VTNGVGDRAGGRGAIPNLVALRTGHPGSMHAPGFRIERPADSQQPGLQAEPSGATESDSPFWPNNCLAAGQHFHTARPPVGRTDSLRQSRNAHATRDFPPFSGQGIVDFWGRPWRKAVRTHFQLTASQGLRSLERSTASSRRLGKPLYRDFGSGGPEYALRAPACSRFWSAPGSRHPNESHAAWAEHLPFDQRLLCG